MVFNFTATPDFDFMTYFAQQLRVMVHDDRLVIPDWLGQGSIRKLSFGPAFKVTIHRYLLREDLVVNRTASGLGNGLITIFFYSNEQPLAITYDNSWEGQFSQRAESAVQVTSNDLSSSIRFPAHQPINYVVVAITPAYLKNLLAVGQPNSVLQTITTDGNSFLFFERVTAEIRLLLQHMAAIDMSDSLSHFGTQVKVQELLYLLFRTLAQRQSATHQAINSADAERLLAIRNEIISELSVPPVIHDLAQQAAMSETKLKQLFKQTFGQTIYNYYQQVRLEEAAFLLKQGRYAVADVGHRLGFTNLSHFSRLFEKQYGLTPKRYASS